MKNEAYGFKEPALKKMVFFNIITYFFIFVKGAYAKFRETGRPYYITPFGICRLEG